MRVLVVTVVHDPEDARIRHRQVAALLRAGHKVALAAPFQAYGRTPPDGVEAIDLPRARGRRRLRALSATRRLLRRRAAGADVVLLHDPELLLAAGRRVRKATRVVWDVHEDTGAALGMKTWLPARLRPLALATVRVAEAWAERNVTLLLAEDAYATRFRRPHPVVPNSVLVPDEEPLPPGAGRAVYLGRLTEPRGALDLVALGERLRGQVRVELIGDADADVRDRVAQAHESGAVVWHGFVPNDEALTMLPGATAGLSLLHDQPNYAHSRPTKLMEYMANGLPVVTTPNPVSVELVARYGCGGVVPFGDAEAAAQAVLRLHADAGLRRDQGERGRRAAVAHLNWWNDADHFVRALDG